MAGWEDMMRRWPRVFETSIANTDHQCPLPPIQDPRDVELGFIPQSPLSRTKPSAHLVALDGAQVLAHKIGRGIYEHIHEQYARILVLSQGKSDGASSDDNNAARTLQLLEVGGCVARRAKGDFLNDTRLSLEAKHRNFVEAIMMRASIPEDWEERCAFAGFVTAEFHFRPTEWCCSTRIPSSGSRPTGVSHHTNTLTMKKSRCCSSGEEIILLCAGYMNLGLVLRAPGDDYNQPLLMAGIYRQINTPLKLGCDGASTEGAFSTIRLLFEHVLP